MNFEEIKSKILIGYTNIIQNRLSNNYIRNILNNVVYPPTRFFWFSVFGYVNWHKAWRTVDKFYINNRVKEVSFKIMHRIYPVKHVLERFKLETDYSCDFCKDEK